MFEKTEFTQSLATEMSVWNDKGLIFWLTANYD